MFLLTHFNSSIFFFSRTLPKQTVSSSQPTLGLCTPSYVCLCSCPSPPAMQCLPCVSLYVTSIQSTPSGISEEHCIMSIVCVGDLVLCVCVGDLGCVCMHVCTGDICYVCMLCTEIPGHKRISFEEFLPLYNSQRQKKEQGSMEDFIEGLKVFDKEGNGLINSAELRHVLTSLGECTPHQHDCMYIYTHIAYITVHVHCTCTTHQGRN